MVSLHDCCAISNCSTCSKLMYVCINNILFYVQRGGAQLLAFNFWGARAPWPPFSAAYVMRELGTLRTRQDERVSFLFSIY